MEGSNRNFQFSVNSYKCLFCSAEVLCLLLYHYEQIYYFKALGWSPASSSFFSTAGGLQCQSTIPVPVQKAQFMPTSSGFQSRVFPQSSANATELFEGYITSNIIDMFRILERFFSFLNLVSFLNGVLLSGYGLLHKIMIYCSTIWGSCGSTSMVQLLREYYLEPSKLIRLVEFERAASGGKKKKFQSIKIDPELSRTVIVSTKLDTRIPQFARPSDVEVSLSPPACTLDGCILGDSPFSKSVYWSNDEFKQAICFREIEDFSSLEEKLGRSLSKQERNRIGVSKLRWFLEELLKQSLLIEVKLKEKGSTFNDLFLTKKLLGSIVFEPRPCTSFNAFL
ncbi:hypothetical protein PIB30_062783 [Stylosanthes scabra]|uniref:Uncharacterized protein n=1 Tax=Stylosanthes scabra TaxID=79078 RepID=A0ABU6QLL7_9FABA|nr:hypothetical protein [Stylosanthes scabra]